GGWEGCVVGAAEALRQAPTGAGAGEGDADDGVGCDAIVEPAGEARDVGGEIMAADHRHIAAGAVAAAEARAPYAPALLEARRLRRCFQHRRISERDILGHILLLGREAERWAARAGDAVAAVDEGIEHQREELVA